MTNLEKDILVCYHESCIDGFTAATVAYRQFGDRADYLPVQYNKPYDVSIFQDKEVYILDFSFKRDFCLHLQEICTGITIIDHHKTAQSELGDLDFAIFDMTKSGALLTWEYFFPDKEAPLLVQYVSKYDLWEHTNPEVKTLNRYLVSKDFILEEWLILMENLEKIAVYKRVIEEGKAINRFTDKQVSIITKHASRCYIDSHYGLIVNCSSIFTSEVGNALARESFTFGATYTITSEGKVLVSLRSEGEYDVSILAKYFGGGGHKNAAGFTIPLSELVFDEQNNVVIKNKVRHANQLLNNLT